MTENSTATVWHEVASPFCGIASDDLTIEVNGNTVKVLENGDAVTRPGFETPITDTQPRINGKEVTLDQAVSHIADLLINSKQPLIAGLGTDLNGARAAMALADKSGATIDSYYSPAAFRNILVLQDTGYMTTTLTEVRNRVDLLVLVGTDIESTFPRFYERMVWNKESMFGQDIESREVIYLGKTPSGDASTSPNGKKAQVIACDNADLPEVVSVLRALVKGKQIQAETVAGVAVSDLSALADKLNAAKYSVVTWSAGQLDIDHAEATIQNVCEMIKEINATTRSNGLPIGGKEGDTTVNAVASWQSGYPMRTTFNRRFPDYDPFLNDSRRILANDESDLLIWVSSFNTAVTPPQSSANTIVLGRSGMQFETEPEVYIPVGVPGIDHEGRTFRSDSVVSVPLRKLRDSGLPSVFEVLSVVEQAL
ncbi:MAG TPA: formylmethanofuran dehydrogenase subunit B [Methylophaga sp.]|jgi:formylmethanofuran dehydrogenase subunit B|uniref:formylmethanofuran dehydrogenase subunit B n=1 Tax=unclassified Methylophaga TaxID=2629249 RepID=UPI000C97EE2A|nr:MULTISPECIES: formylmethanofuran dehydrogenase subunit B [unclassified Methylophaga]MAP27465.1 formylmethanofuran dehydrogenase subunit B [Methylophaga sp.]HAD31894.1 formylmethanofuran dehydrogenase subunit B [Methylophaga sp.]HBX61101.1 formylmethanofuran dehydrogenase subunit B [Methylophaga sp.]HCO01236.1 formylmethanofuran dehydrogenase subunit B [Methylophaga sp.]|tara:strand:+ start:3578 stop:4852 length:1275 start_codon:yes stop_codon:yes gene_type:complete